MTYPYTASSHGSGFSISIGPLPAWRADAGCLDEDPELFFPLGSTGQALDQIARAKAVCRRCPVIAQCLEWAIQTKQDAGVWGGKSEDERRAIRRSRQRRRNTG